MGPERKRHNRKPAEYKQRADAYRNLAKIATGKMFDPSFHHSERQVLYRVAQSIDTADRAEGRFRSGPQPSH
jgi:hypothetical protein